ncbi:hypothetical protein AC578_4221 [Pseudocercospora eumusae]|uniref:Uncharacterized protein n=1 Tax=Pseudocercospora eumusae TaxID=321146 RepID=A0A139H364_9PEZI|nr:hypothetical protein AC578_4221 [Pseudocercospora eumusae]
MGPLGAWRYEPGRSFYALSTRDLVLNNNHHHHHHHHHQTPAQQVKTSHEFLQLARSNRIHLYNWQKNRIARVARELHVQRLEHLTTLQNVSRLIEVCLEAWPCYRNFTREEQQVAADTIVKWLRIESVNRWFADNKRRGDESILEWDETHYPAPTDSEHLAHTEMSETRRGKPQPVKSKGQQVVSQEDDEHVDDASSEQHGEDAESLDGRKEYGKQFEQEPVDEEQWQEDTACEFERADDDSTSDLYRVICEHDLSPLACGQIVQLRRVGKNPGKSILSLSSVVDQR